MDFAFELIDFLEKLVAGPFDSRRPKIHKMFSFSWFEVRIKDC